MLQLIRPALYLKEQLFSRAQVRGCSGRAFGVDLISSFILSHRLIMRAPYLREIIMHVLEHTSYTAAKSIMVILTLPVRGIYPLIGPLVDISQSGLRFTYLPLQSDIDIPMKGPCQVVFRYGSRSFSEPIPCKIVYETVSPTRFSSMLPVRCCGIQFLTPLSASDIESICA
jgi:hypothetical protein